MEQKISFSAAGDALTVRKITKGNKDFNALSEFISQADACIVNVETVISDYTCFPSAYCGEPWVNAEPEVLHDLLQYGFNMLGLANNHSMDFSYDGLYQTMEACKTEDVAYAGIGMNLYEANKPAILDLPHGRVGMISLCSSFNDAARAGEQGNALPGRPGLNPLRVNTEYIVTPEQMKVLKEIADGTNLSGQQNNAIEAGFSFPPAEGCISFLKNTFREGDTTAKRTTCNPNDLERILKTIRESMDYLDHIVVCIHSHQIKRANYNEPDYFFEVFARKCIDAGASAVIGGGTHQFKPIEIYKGKPIFYSLGDFIFQNHLCKIQPPDYMEYYKVPTYSSTVEAVRANRTYGTLPLQADIKNYLSVIPYFEFEGKKMTKLVMKPIELNFHACETLKGIPAEADEETAINITNYLNEISACYGTRMSYKEGLIEVEIPE